MQRYDKEKSEEWMKLISCESYEEMSRRAANVISAQVVLHPKSVLGLATGETPIGTYRKLIERCKKGDLDFSNIKTVNLDEYYPIEPENPQSYRYFMDQQLFMHINIPRQNTYVPNGTGASPEAEGSAYDALIASLGGIDLQLLGIGHNGHIGFNEPGEVFEAGTHVVTLGEQTRQANARFFDAIEEVPHHAITMGMQSILQARRILLIANGKGKQEILRQALNGPITPNVPASILQLHPNLTVISCFTEQ